MTPVEHAATEMARAKHQKATLPSPGPGKAPANWSRIAALLVWLAAIGTLAALIYLS